MFTDGDTSEEGDSTSNGETAEAPGSDKNQGSRQASKYDETEEISYSKAENKYYKKNIDGKYSCTYSWMHHM